MSSEDADTDPKILAQRAERDLNSHTAKHGSAASDSATESGVDTSNISNFPGGSVTYGSAASGGGDNREIPEEEGGGIDRTTGRPLKARDFEGEGGPEDKAARRAEERGGDDEVRGNVRQGGDTVRP